MKSNVLLRRGGVLLSVYLFAALVLFITSGTFSNWKAWTFLGLSFFPVFFFVVFLAFSKTRILEINIDFKSIFKANLKKIIIFGTIFTIGLIISGITYRLHVNQLPDWISIQFSVIFLFAMILFLITCKEYKILSRHLFEMRRKKLIDQGPYSIVRHPMYSTLILLSLCVPLILGSIISFVIFLIFPIYMIIKMYKEEKELLEEIKDYEEYKEKVKYKLIPYIW